MSCVAQALLDAHERSSRCAIRGRLAAKLLRAVRAAHLRVADPLVRYEIDGVPLWLPLSHDLPYIRRHAPHYGRNLVRVACAMHECYPNLTAIDIGANVGDSVAFLRGRLDVPVLCVEGSAAFLPMLRENVGGIAGVEIECAFVGPPGMRGLRVRDKHGSARLVAGGPGEEKPIVALEQMLERHPNFAGSKLLKIDTDGFDTLVITSSKTVLAGARPVIFFEYFPDLIPADAPSIEVFGFLAALGYRAGIAFDSTGEFLVGFDPADGELVADLHRRWRGNAYIEYGDICVFHEDDSEVAAALRATERARPSHPQKPAR